MRDLKKTAPESHPEPAEPIDDPPELTREDFERAIRSDQRERIVAGRLEAGDVAALRRFVGLTQEQFAEALGISVRTLQNWDHRGACPCARPCPGHAQLDRVSGVPGLLVENSLS